MTDHPPSGGPGNGAHIRLIRHVDSAAGSVRLLEVGAALLSPDLIGVEFTLSGDLNALRIPPPGPGGRAEALWRHTCFEAFVRREDVPGYLEFNFSPSGAWQAYHFSGYRQGRLPAGLPVPPSVSVRRCGSEAIPAQPAAGAAAVLAVAAAVHLPAPFHATPPGLRLALSAVVEEDSGALSYWALRHAPGRPDFHHPDAFVLTLAGH